MTLNSMAHTIQMVDLHRQYLRLKPEIDQSIADVLNHTRFINGPETDFFAKQLANYLNVKHVIPCANGTDALQVAIMSLGLSRGDEIITPTFTFIATVEVIALLGLKPVLVDVDPHTFNIDVAQIENAITPKTKAILPVHLFGQGADMDSVLALAKKYSLFVIEDAAQCLGASAINGNGQKTKLGTLGDIGCTSFFPSKNLGAFGDGGACFTNNDELAETLKCIVNHGATKKYYHSKIGINSRLDTLQAAVLSAKLNHLDDFNRRRQEAANQYDDALTGIHQLQLPYRNTKSDHIFHQYTLKVLDGSRKKLIDHLTQHQVPTMIYYPRAIHHQEAFLELGLNNDEFPVANLLTEQVLSLPMHTEMDIDQIEYITRLIQVFYR